MTDAPGPSSGKKPVDAANKKLDGKKRFEVKKVYRTTTCSRTVEPS